MRPALLALALAALGCDESGTESGSRELDSVPASATAEGLELRWPRFVLRAGRASLGALDALVPDAHADPPAATVLEGGDVEVDADRLSLDGGSGAAHLSGHVRLRRGELSLTCDRLETRADASGALVEARAEGNVRVQRGALVATAARARLDLARGEVVLDGPVRLVRAEGTLEGARVVLRLADGGVTVERARGRLRLRAAEPPR